MAAERLEDFINQDNWPTDLVAAKEFASEAIRKWKWKEKAPKYLARISRATNVQELQRLVVNTLLSGEGQSVIR